LSRFPLETALTRAAARRVLTSVMLANYFYNAYNHTPTPDWFIWLLIGAGVLIGLFVLFLILLFIFGPLVSEDSEEAKDCRIINQPEGAPLGKPTAKPTFFGSTAQSTPMILIRLGFPGTFSGGRPAGLETSPPWQSTPPRHTPPEKN